LTFWQIWAKSKDRFALIRICCRLYGTEAKLVAYAVVSVELDKIILELVWNH